VNRRTLAVVAAASLIALAGCSGSITFGEQTTTAAQNQTATVVDVVDGDTVDVRFEDGSVERVRLLGVDTPETHDDVSPGEFEGVPDTDAGRSCLRTWGEHASDFADQRLAGETVTVEFDPVSDRRGGYDRLLAYIVVDGGTSETPRTTGTGEAADGDSFNRALLEAGYARLYDSEFTKRDDYASVERQARENGTGLWECAS
jgi:micrococcal nuclease